MTQCEMVLKYINDFGSITSLEAFKDLNCTRLSGRIYDLRKQGFEFNKEIITKKNRYGKKVSYVKYTLKE